MTWDANPDVTGRPPANGGGPTYFPNSISGPSTVDGYAWRNA